MKVTYTQNRFEIDGVEIINPEVLKLIPSEQPGFIQHEIGHFSFSLPDNIIAEKVYIEPDESIHCNRGVDRYRLKLKEPLVDTGSKESQDIIIEDLMNEFAPDWYKNYDDCPNIYEEIKSKFIISRK